MSELQKSFGSNIKVTPVLEQRIGTFAQKHGLIMHINERMTGQLPRFTAQFDSCEVKDGAILASVYGNGNTPDEAIADYAKQIELKLLVIDAMTPKRREIRTPRLAL